MNNKCLIECYKKIRLTKSFAMIQREHTQIATVKFISELKYCSSLAKRFIYSDYTLH